MSQVETPPAPPIEQATLEAALCQVKAHRTRHGTMIAPALDAYVGRSFELYGEYCPAETNALIGLLRPGMTVVEVGANLGAHTIPIARKVAPGAVYVFEPQQRIFQMLCTNLTLNAVRNVVALPEAAGAQDGSARLPILDYGARNNFGAVAVQSAKALDGAHTVQVRAIDSLHLNACHLIKADAEGWEADVIRGAGETIAKFRPVLYLDNEKPKHQQALVDLVDGLGYDMWWHAPLLYHPKNFNGRVEDVFPGVACANMFCTPKEKQVNVQGLVKIDPKDLHPPLRIPERGKGPV
ncbi:MAG: FkbM family methyltransferase [Phenylobacterium sp.]